MHALIIEDETLIAMSIEDALRDCGCTSIDIACSVEAAIEAASLRCPDIITADVQLQPGCGIDAVQAICAKKHIPAVYITGTSVDVQERVANPIIVQKPFCFAQVAKAVELALS